MLARFLLQISFWAATQPGRLPFRPGYRRLGVCAVCLILGVWLGLVHPPTHLWADARQPDTRPPTTRTNWQVQDLAGALTATDLALALVGPGVTVQKATYQGAPIAAGLFDGGGAALGFPAGVVLSTGLAQHITGPNRWDSVSFTHALPGDVDLAPWTDSPLYDAAALSVEFIPDAPLVYLSYVWSSEEYNEFVFTAFADLLGIFVNGENVAVVDGQPISVDVINGGNPYATLPHSHPELYRNNDLDDGGGNLDIEADGLTLLLRVAAGVTPYQVNHLKIVLADAGDTLLDSFVLLPTGGLTTAQPTSVEQAGWTGRPAHNVVAYVWLGGAAAGGCCLWRWRRRQRRL